MLPATTDAGEQPLRIAMSLPESAKTLEQLRCDRHLTGLVTLAMRNANDEALAIDMFRLDLQRLAEAKTTLINDREIGTIATLAEAAQEESDFVTGKDMGERFGAMNLDLLPNVPIAIEVIAVEKADRAERLIDGAALEPPFLLEVDEEVENFPGTNSRGVIGRVE